MSVEARTAPATETAPAEGAPSTALALIAESSPPPATAATPPPVSLLPTPPPLPWEAEKIKTVPAPFPLYGTPEWEQLPDGPVKLASCVLSAYRWRTRHQFPYPPISGTLAYRRRIEEARRPREGDFLGGQVEW